MALSTACQGSSPWSGAIFSRPRRCRLIMAASSASISCEILTSSDTWRKLYIEGLSQASRPAARDADHQERDRNRERHPGQRVPDAVLHQREDQPAGAEHSQRRRNPEDLADRLPHSVVEALACHDRATMTRPSRRLTPRSIAQSGTRWPRFGVASARERDPSPE